jgi:hypothetical protein
MRRHSRYLMLTRNERAVRREKESKSDDCWTLICAALTCLEHIDRDHWGHRYGHLSSI